MLIHRGNTLKAHQHISYSVVVAVTFLNPIRSGGGALKAPPLRFFALTHLILDLHYCELVTFPKK